MDTLRLQVILESLDNATKPLQGILKGTSALGKAAKETRDRLRDLNAQNKQLESFRTTTARVTETAQALQAARDRVRDLGSAIAAAERPSKALTDEYKAATRELRTLATVHDRAAQAQRVATADMQRAGIPVTELASRQRHLAQEIASATAQLERQGNQINRVKTLQSSYRNTLQARDRIAGAGASTAAVGAATGLPLISTVKDFAGLQTATTDLKIAMMESGKHIPAEFDKIAEKARQLGARLPGTSQDFMLAGKSLVEQGVNFKSIVDGGLEATSYLAVLLKLEKDRAAEFIAKAREVHGLQDRDLPAGADLMQRARFGFGLKPDQIYESMAYSGTDINIKGLVGDLQKMKEYLALQGMAANVGLEGSSFGTNFAHMLKAMANVNKLDDAKGSEGRYVRDILASKSIKFDFFNAAGQFAGFGKMVQELEKLKQFNPQQQERILKKLFDTEGGRPAAIFLKNGMQGFQDALEKMDKQANLNDRVNESLGTLQNRWDALGGAVNDFTTKVGGILSPAVEGLIDRVGKLMGGLSDFVEENPRISTALTYAAALFAGVATAVGALLLAVSALLGPLALFRFAIAAVGLPSLMANLGKLSGAVLPAISKALQSFGQFALRAIAPIATAIMATPIGWLLGGIALLAGAAAVIYKYWDPIRAFMQGFWEGLSNSAGDALSKFWDACKGLLKSLGDLLMSIEPIRLAFELLSAVVSPIWDVISAGISKVWDWLKRLITPVEDINGAARSMGKIWGQAAGDIVSALLSIPTQAYEVGKQIISRIAEGIREKLNLVKEILTKIGYYASGGSVSRDLLGANTPVASPPPLRVGGGNVSISSPTTIHITPHPTQSPQDIGREVDKRLDERDRQRAAQRRSVFADTN